MRLLAHNQNPFRLRSVFHLKQYFFVLLLLAGMTGEVDLSASDLLRYENRIIDGPIAIHLLYVDPEAYSIVAVRAHDRLLGRETVSAMARKKNAIAAVNGGFFRMGGAFDGEPVGVLKIGDDWYSDSPLSRGVIGWNQEKEIHLIRRLRTLWRIQTPEGEFNLAGLNRPAGSELAVLFTRQFKSQIPSNLASYILIRDERVDGIHKTLDRTHYPFESVLVVGSDSELANHRFKVGDQVKIVTEFESDQTTASENRSRWNEMEYIVGGTPVLIQAGKPVKDYSPEEIQRSFIVEKHPRTAVGILANGHWLFLVVDGRRPGKSIGMTLEELTSLMLDLECQDALNLDGGGSSTLYYEGEVRNTPSDPIGERPVSDAIVIIE